MWQWQNIFVNSSAQCCTCYAWRPYKLNHCLELSLWRSIWLIVYSGVFSFQKNSIANNTVFSLYRSPLKNLILIFLLWLPAGFLACACFVCLGALWLPSLIEVNIFLLFLCLVQKVALCFLLYYLNEFQTVFQNSHMGTTMEVVSNCWWKLL